MIDSERHWFLTGGTEELLVLAGAGPAGRGPERLGLGAVEPKPFCAAGAGCVYQQDAVVAAMCVRYNTAYMIETHGCVGRHKPIFCSVTG
eukprot:COSAG05_NODE_107_length_18696_cov_209.227766_4_plen_90_part_00